MVDRVAYLLNQYPKVSHSFIRTEMLALEARGIAVERIAMRGWDAEVVDRLDHEERTRTRYVLRSPAAVLGAVLMIAVTRPIRFAGALSAAWRLSRGAERGLLHHLIYLAEACLAVRWLLACRAEAVHAHFGSNATTVALLARRLGGPPYSFTVHGPEEFDKPLQWKLREKIAGAAFVVAISSFGRSQLYRWADEGDWGKIAVVSCALDDRYLAAPPTPVPATRTMVCIGRLCEQKGQLLLVEAAALLHRRGIDLRLVLAGDGEMRGTIEAAVARHGLGERVRITGWLDVAGVRDELLKARAMVLPSFAEGLPVVIMEAMALGRPVVTTMIAGIPELVRDGREGWLVPAGDVEALADALQDALAAPVERLAALADAGAARVRERHDSGTEAAKLATLFAHAQGAVTYTR